MKRRLKLLENKVAKFLNRYPFIKDILRNVRHAIYKPKFKFQIPEGLILQPVESAENEQSFFGYYTNLNANSKGEFIYHKTLEKERIPPAGSKSTISLFDVVSGKSTNIAETSAWNWQQGSMLQWFDEGNRKIIFNDFDTNENKYITRIVDVDKQSNYRVFDQAYYTFSNTRGKLFSLNFDRLMKYRPEYGYNCKGNIELPEEEVDGIWEIDVETGDSQLIIPLSKLRNIAGSDVGPLQWVNHIQLNRSGSKFIFLNRWFVSDYKFRSRLMLFDLESQELKMLFESDNISHFDWSSEDEIIIWAEVDGEGQSYKKYDLNQRKFLEIGKKYLYGDGHPSLSRDNEVILSDTYPDKSRLSTLILYHHKSDNYQELGKFYQPLKFNEEMRCDLHPRWSGFNDYITFDSAHSGKRELYLLNIENPLKNIYG